MKLRGFTAVELLIVIVIMAILLILAVVNVRSTQINGRDNERTVDVENTALSLETYYNTSSNSDRGGGSRYPGVSSISADELKVILPDFDQKNIKTPGNNSDAGISIVPASNNIETVEGVLPQPTIDSYVYQAINTNGTLCIENLTESCRRFNIFYRLEMDNTVYVLRSKNR